MQQGENEPFLIYLALSPSGDEPRTLLARPRLLEYWLLTVFVAGSFVTGLVSAARVALG